MNEASAGGVVYRKQANGISILVIQDRYGKATLPKGKVEQGETLEETALREIFEETGITGTIERPLMQVAYQYVHANGQTVDKTVRYYLVEATGGEVQAQEEEIRSALWVEPQDAWRLQAESGYRNNDPVLREALRALGFNGQPV